MMIVGLRVSTIKNCLNSKKQINTQTFVRPFSFNTINISKKYEQHIPTNCFQKLVLTAGASIGALADPTRADLVSIVGETTSSSFLDKLVYKMKEDETGREILINRKSIRFTEDEENYLRQLPSNSFGKSYMNWMDQFGYSSMERPFIRFIDDEEKAFVFQRYKEIHDFWHVLVGLNTSVMEEIAVKHFEFAQTGLPVTILSALGGPLKLSFREQQILFFRLLPWASRSGRNAKCLMNVQYENYFETDIDELRRMLRIEIAPSLNY